MLEPTYAHMILCIVYACVCVCTLWSRQECVSHAAYSCGPDEGGHLLPPFSSFSSYHHHLHILPDIQTTSNQANLDSLCLYFTHTCAHTHTHSATSYWVGTNVDALCFCMKQIGKKKWRIRKDRSKVTGSTIFNSQCYLAEVKPKTLDIILQESPPTPRLTPLWFLAGMGLKPAIQVIFVQTCQIISNLARKIFE